MPPKNESQLEFYRLISIPTLERVEVGLPETLRDMAKFLDVQYATVIKWHAKAKAMGISKINKPDEPKLLPLTQLEKEKALFMKNLTRKAASDNATAPTMALYAEIVGLTKKKLDITVGLSADEIARRNLTAIKELEEGGFK